MLKLKLNETDTQLRGRTRESLFFLADGRRSPARVFSDRIDLEALSPASLWRFLVPERFLSIKRFLDISILLALTPCVLLLLLVVPLLIRLESLVAFRHSAIEV